MHDWCGTFHFHTFKRSLLAPAANRPSALRGSKLGSDPAFLVRLPGTRVALCSWRGPRRCWLRLHTCVCSFPPIAESCMSYFQLRAQSVSLRRKRGEGSRPWVWCGWTSWKPLDQGADVLRTYDVIGETYEIKNPAPCFRVAKQGNSTNSLKRVLCTDLSRFLQRYCMWFDIIGKFRELTLLGQTKWKWAALLLSEGRSVQVQRELRVKTNTLAGFWWDGTVTFSHISTDSSVHNHTNQVVIMALRQTFQI